MEVTKEEQEAIDAGLDVVVKLIDLAIARVREHHNGRPLQNLRESVKVFIEKMDKVK